MESTCSGAEARVPHQTAAVVPDVSLFEGDATVRPLTFANDNNDGGQLL